MATVWGKIKLAHLWLRSSVGFATKVGGGGGCNAVCSLGFFDQSMARRFGSSILVSSRLFEEAPLAIKLGGVLPFAAIDVD
jgi:hypothetical protein